MVAAEEEAAEGAAVGLAGKPLNDFNCRLADIHSEPVVDPDFVAVDAVVVVDVVVAVVVVSTLCGPPPGAGAGASTSSYWYQETSSHYIQYELVFLKIWFKFVSRFPQKPLQNRGSTKKCATSLFTLLLQVVDRR